MLTDFHLVAVVRERKKTDLFRIPLHQSLRDHLMESWGVRLREIVNKLDRVDFRAGYQLKKHQCFQLLGFSVPSRMGELTSQTTMTIREIVTKPETFKSIQGTVAYARNIHDEELMLFQDFSPSKVIRPGQFLKFEGENYMITENTGFLLDQQLSAAYLREERTLLFRKFRAVNSFLPIYEFYRKTSELEIRELLNNDKLVAEDPGKWARGANQWFRTRLLQLRDSGILDRYSAEEIKTRSIGFGVPIQIVNNRIVFPNNHESAKNLLRFLNEEFFMGVLSDTIYETNTKRRRTEM